MLRSACTRLAGAGSMLLMLAGLLPLTAAADPPIKIASIYALTGTTAAANRCSVEGVRIAVNEINASGGISGRPVELLELDNQSTPIGSKVAADMAVQNNVTAIIGAAFSSHSMAVAKVAQKHKVPMITNVSTSPPITRVGSFIFRICFNDEFQGRVMAKFAREELKTNGIVAIYDMASDYSIGISATFEKAFVGRGGVMLAKLPYKARQPNFRNIISLARSAIPDVLFISGHSESGRIVAEAINGGISAIPLGGDGWDEPGFFEMGGNIIKLGYYTTHWHQDVETDHSRRFVEHYGISGKIWAPTALAYDAVHLLFDAIRRARSAHPTAVRDAIAGTTNFKGVTGAISFDENGDPIKNAVIMKIGSGIPVYLKQVGADYLD